VIALGEIDAHDGDVFEHAGILPVKWVFVFGATRLQFTR